MARERASIGVEIWGDADFRDLTPAAQALWLKLYSHPLLDYCGVVNFHPGRLAALSREQTALDVLTAAQELSTKHWIVVDQDTDEVMVRGFLRHDGLLKQWRLAISAAKAYAAIGSNKIRAVVVHEIQRYKRENPDLAAWEQGQVKALLKQSAVDVHELNTELSLPFQVTPGPIFDRTVDQVLGLAYDHRLDQTPTGTQHGVTPTPTPTPTPATGSNDPADHERTDSSTAIRARAAALRVDFAKVSRRVTQQAGETIPDDVVMRLIVEAVGRSKHRDGDRTGLVLTSIQRDWAEWSRLVFQVAS